MEDKKYFGIDFGTTNTAVVVINKFGTSGKDMPLGEDNGEVPFSSIVAIPKDGSSNLLFGREVRRKRIELSQTHEIFTSMKSYLGTEYEFIVGESRYSATYITTQFLKHVKQNIIANFGDKFDIQEATFSFPVDFSPEARRELKKAAIAAGITPKGFISESTAAYIANTQSVKALNNVLVLDWGGGTYDVSVLQATENKLVELSVWGDKIGGDNIDIELAQIAHNYIVSKSNVKIPFEDMSPSEKDNLISICERAKIDFSFYADDYPLTVQNYGQYGTKEVNLSYQSFKELIEVIITDRILPTINTALKRANLPKSKVNGIVVVGGSSNIKPYADAITNIFISEDQPINPKFILPENPDWSVAKGTAKLDITGTSINLYKTLGLLLSDNTVFPVLKKYEHGIGSQISPITFALIEDSEEAHFIFVNDEGHPYTKEYVPTKGFMNENLILNAKITDEQIAQIKIKSDAIGQTFEKEIELNKLTFYYNLEGWDI